MLRFILIISGLTLSGCGFFDRAPDAKAIYEALKNVSSQPFNIDSVGCRAQGVEFACAFDATIVSGSVAGPVGDRRPEYRRVRMAARFSRSGDLWKASGVEILSDAPTTP